MVAATRAKIDFSKAVFPKGYSPWKTRREGQWFDHGAADRAIRFIETQLRHHDGAKAGELFLLERWQQNIVATVFGWKNVDGTRRYREVYLEVPRGNGKSAFAAAIACYFLFVEPEFGKQLYSIAGNEDQAMIIFADAKAMIEGNPKLARLGKAFKRTISVRRTGSFFKALTSKPGTKHGLRASLVLCDELHEFKTRDLLDALITSQGKRLQPLTMITTTAGIFDETSIWWEKRRYAMDVIRGTAKNSTFLPIVYSLEQDEDWEDEAAWKRANPNWGVTVNPQFLRAEYAKAKAILAYQNVFRRLYLDQVTAQVARWMDMDKWTACDRGVDERKFLRAECVAGLDLGQSDDLSAFVMLFRRGGLIHLIPRFWLPELCLAKEPMYEVWARQGLIEVTEGDFMDYDLIAQEIIDLKPRFRIKKLAIDRFQANQLTTQLQRAQLDVVFFGQGFASMTAPTRELEHLVAAKKIAGINHPVLRWMASNAQAKHGENGAIKILKPKQGGKKVDGIVATVMGIGVLSELKDAPQFKKTGGLRSL